MEVVVSAIIRKEDKILLTRSPRWSNKWTFPGGHIEAGEQILRAAEREAEDETGLKLNPVEILTFGEIINPKDFYRPGHFIYFDCIFNVVGGKLKLQATELSDSQWLTPEEALNLDLASGYQEVLQKYIKWLSDLQ